MTHIHLITIGKNPPQWIQDGYSEYSKRLNADIKLELIELEAAKRLKTTNIQQILLDESKRILSAIPKNSFKIALDVKGQSWSTEQLATKLRDWQNRGHSHIALIVGGPDGLHETCLEQMDLRWSLSPLTFPHPLVRVIIAEQLYRAWTINQGHPYHRV